jgi:hypothetical protein
VQLPVLYSHPPRQKPVPEDLTKINFIDAKDKIGENSIGISLRNPNLQLRAEPAYPQTPVSPWQNSTIDPDSFRKPRE